MILDKEFGFGFNIKHFCRNSTVPQSARQRQGGVTHGALMTCTQAKTLCTPEGGCASCATTLCYYYSQFTDRRMEGEGRYSRLHSK